MDIAARDKLVEESTWCSTLEVVMVVLSTDKTVRPEDMFVDRGKLEQKLHEHLFIIFLFFPVGELFLVEPLVPLGDCSKKFDNLSSFESVFNRLTKLN